MSANLADLFIQMLDRDEETSECVRKVGRMLAEKYKENLETVAILAKQHCEMFYKLNPPKHGEPARDFR
jgi:hypothetical protein